MSLFEQVTDVVSIRDVIRRLQPEAEPIRKGDFEVYSCLTGNHVDEDPSFYDYGDHYHCFSCKDHGDAVALFAALKGIENGVEAAYELADGFHVDLPELDPTLREILRERRAKEEEFLQEARELHSNLEDHPAAVEWLENRGIGSDLRASFLLGVLEDGSGVSIPYFDQHKRPQSIIIRYFAGDPTYYYQPIEDFVGGRRGLMAF